MKDIKGYEGLYAITSCGRVWSYRSKKFLKPKRRKDNYLEVCLCKNGNQKSKLIHQLVAEAYLPNPNNYPVVLHLDGAESRDHNWINNLKWGTQKENCNEPIYKGRRSKRIRCIETGEIYPSMKEAERQIGIAAGSISNCCHGKRKTAGGYKWKFI